MESNVNEDLDHIIWACNDLETGSRRFEAMTGVQPHYGGVHASGVTHNALVALGGRCYLEILAPVGPPAPNDDAWTRLARAAQEPRLLTYCLRSKRPLSELASIAQTNAWPKATVANNGRTTPEGIRLRWQWLAPTAEAYGLAFPFFIDWLDSAHPARSLSAARPHSSVQLQLFSGGHPDAQGLERTLAQFGASIETYAAEGVEFKLQLQTPKGVVSL